MRRLLTILAFTLSIVTNAREVPPILKKLAEAPGSVVTFAHFSEAIFPIPDLPTNFLNVAQHILKTPEGLFLLTTGTGRVYKISLDGDSINLIRMDKTFFTGYNFQSLSFTLNGKLYSFGGYGFWRMNGDLRVFMPSVGEWDAIPTNIYIPKNFLPQKPGSIHFIDTLDQLLYTSGPTNIGDNIKEQSSKSSQYSGKLLKLHIKDGIWEELGTVEDIWFQHIAYTPWGLLTHTDKEFQILDLRQNKIRRLTGKTNEKLIHTPTSTNYQDIRLSYCIGNIVYVGDIDHWIDSIVIEPKDLVDTGKSIYTSKSHLHIIMIAGILFICFIILLIYFIRKIKNPKELNDGDVSTTITRSFNPTMKTELLEEREKELLEYILNQSKKGKLTSIIQINDLLGLNKRTIEVQKRIRTDMITAINTKCKFLTTKEEPMLSRSRAELDKRMFEYFVLPERFAEADAILNNKEEDQKPATV